MQPLPVRNYLSCAKITCIRLKSFLCQKLMQVRAFYGLAGHYRRFTKGFTNIACPLYDILGKEMKTGPMQLPPEVREVVQMLKEKILTLPLLAFPDFAKPFLLEMDASKEGLGAVLSQKQDDGRFHPVAFGSHSLMPTERNYHSSKLEFLALKWASWSILGSIWPMLHLW